MFRIIRAKNRLAWQREPTEAHLRHAPNLSNRAFEITSGDSGHRRHTVVVWAKRLPRPIVIHSALGLRELWLGGGPHQEPFVRKNNFGIDAIALHVFEPQDRVSPRFLPLEVFPVEDRV